MSDDHKEGFRFFSEVKGGFRTGAFYGVFLGIREVVKAPGSFKNNRRSNDVAATSLGASSIQAPFHKVS